MRARNRRGFGKKRWSSQWLYDTLGSFNRYRVVRAVPQAKISSMNRPHSLEAKQAGKPSAGNPHAGFDEAGTGNGLTVWLVRHSRTCCAEPESERSKTGSDHGIKHRIRC
jgi:hypothetical protein